MSLVDPTGSIVPPTQPPNPPPHRHHPHCPPPPTTTTTTSVATAFPQCCCYCEPGSPVNAYTAPAPLGPYTDQGLIDLTGARHGDDARLQCLAAGPKHNSRAALLAILTGTSSNPTDVTGGDTPTSACNSRASRHQLRGGGGGTPIRAQQTDIFRYFDSSGVEQFGWIGDHWQSAPDRVKAHGESHGKALASGTRENCGGSWGRSSQPTSLGAPRLLLPLRPFPLCSRRLHRVGPHDF